MSSYDLKGSRCIVKIHQDNHNLPSASPKPRISTSYSSPSIPIRSSPSTFTTAAPIQDRFTPSPSPSCESTKPKRLLVSNTNNNYVNKTERQQPFPPVRTSINDVNKDNTFKIKERDFIKRYKFEKPRNMFLSQIYLMFHFAITICLMLNKGLIIAMIEYMLINDYLGKDSNVKFFTNEDAMFYYLAYLLATSIIFLILLKCNGTYYNNFASNDIHSGKF